MRCVTAPIRRGPSTRERLPDISSIEERKALNERKRRKREWDAAVTLSKDACTLFPVQAKQLDRLRDLEADIDATVARKTKELMYKYHQPDWQRRTLRLWVSSEIRERPAAAAASSVQQGGAEWVIRVEGALLNPLNVLDESQVRFSTFFDSVLLQLEEKPFAGGNMFEWQRPFTALAAEQTEEVDGFVLHGPAQVHVAQGLQHFSFRAHFTRRRQLHKGQPVRCAVPQALDWLLPSAGSQTGSERRDDILAALHSYIAENDLFDAHSPGTVLCDAQLQELFGCRSMQYYELDTWLNNHLQQLPANVTLDGYVLFDSARFPQYEQHMDIEVDVDVAPRDAYARHLKKLRQPPTPAVTGAPDAPSTNAETLSAEALAAGSEDTSGVTQDAETVAFETAAVMRRGAHLASEISSRCRRLALLCELGGAPGVTVERLATAHTRDARFLEIAAQEGAGRANYLKGWDPEDMYTFATAVKPPPPELLSAHSNKPSVGGSGGIGGGAKPSVHRR